MPTAPAVWGVATPGGSSRLRVPPLPQDRHGHGVGRASWQEQRHPSLCSPPAALESLLHPQNQLSFHPWALATRFTKSGGQGDGTTSLLSGWRRWKEIPMSSDAPLGWRDKPWSRAEVPLSRRTLPSSPGSRAAATAPGGISCLCSLAAGTLPVFGGLNSHIHLNAKTLPKPCKVQIQVCKPLQRANCLRLFKERTV